MKKILIVDDKPMNLELLASTLELDYETVEAANGLEAVEVARASKPDLVLMDISMPVLDGWGALKAMQEDQTLAEIPVIAVTAHAIAGFAERALKAGFIRYISKPIDPMGILDTIEEILGPPA